MSDLDLQLRQRNVLRLLQGALDGHARPARVVDIGCGSGDVLDPVPRDVVRVAGMDRVPEMVSEAARRHPRDSFVVGDAQRPPFLPLSADVVTCLGVLEYLPEPEVALRSLGELVRPGGRVLFSLPNRTSLLRYLSRVEISLERAASRARRRLQGQPVEDVAGPRYRHRQWSPAEAERLVAAAGLVLERMLFNTYGLWGALGRRSLSLTVSERLSARFSERSFVSARFASTMVLLARRKAP
jgi:SAM-dependent methyltransferase